MADTDAALQDQKKRSLGALERSKRTSVDEDSWDCIFFFFWKSKRRISHSIPDYPIKERYGEANDLSYSMLSHPIHDNLLSINTKMSSRRGSIVDKILHELLQNGDSAQKYMQGSRSLKVDNWIQLDNYVQKQSRIGGGACIRSLRSHSKRSKVHMSMKQHKRCGLLGLPKDLRKFDIFKPMHNMWKDYMIALLKSIGKNQPSQSLLTADLHGAFIIVADCKITSFIGLSGIMIRETAETFGIITQDDKIQVVPKKSSVFNFQVDSWNVIIHGDKLISRT